MFTLQNVLDQLTGKELVDSLIQVMLDNFEDFEKEHIQYEGVMLVLQEKIAHENSPSARDNLKAIEQQISSDLLFSGMLGVKANLDHFINPIARNFLAVDPETYLREDVAHSLPRYKSAQELCDRFYDSLSPELQDLYEVVITYVTHIETVGPKLAHYYGYLLGNQILPLVVPGYIPDMALTSQYRMMLEKYFGQKLKLNSNTSIDSNKSTA